MCASCLLSDCGVFAGAVHSVGYGLAEVPLIGASGAIAGVIGAYVVLHPNIRVWVLFPVPFLSFLPLRFSAGIVIGLWLLYQIVSGDLLHRETRQLGGRMWADFLRRVPYHNHEAARRPPIRRAPTRRRSMRAECLRAPRIDSFAAAK